MRIVFRCPNCRSQLKSPPQLIGRWRNCPGCQHRLIVPAPPLPDSGPIFVFDDRGLASAPQMRLPAVS